MAVGDRLTLDVSQPIQGLNRLSSLIDSTRSRQEMLDRSLRNAGRGGGTGNAGSGYKKVQAEIGATIGQAQRLLQAYNALEKASGGNKHKFGAGHLADRQQFQSELRNARQLKRELGILDAARKKVSTGSWNTYVQSLGYVKATTKGVGDETKRTGRKIKSAADQSRDAWSRVSSTMKTVFSIGAALMFARTITNAIQFAARQAQQAFNFIATNTDKLIGVQARAGMGNGGFASGGKFMDRIFSSSIATRSSFDTFGTSVGQLNAMARGSFSNTGEIIDFVEALQKTFKISGVDPISQHAGTYQLVQAMASGRLQGDELRSISENAPMLRNYIARYMGIKPGELKEEAKLGKVTPGIIIAAMRKARPEIEREFKQLPKSWGDILTEMQNRAVNALRPIGNKLMKFLNSGDMNRVMQNIPKYIELASAGMKKLGDSIMKKLGYANLKHGLQNLDKLVPTVIDGVVRMYDALIAMSPSLETVIDAVELASKVMETLANGIGGLSGAIVTLLAMTGLSKGLTMASMGGSILAQPGMSNGMMTYGTVLSGMGGLMAQAGGGAIAGGLSAAVTNEVIGNGNKAATQVGGLAGGAVGGVLGAASLGTYFSVGLGALGTMAGPIGTALGVAAGGIIGGIVGAVMADGWAQGEKDRKLADVVKNNNYAGYDMYRSPHGYGTMDRMLDPLQAAKNSLFAAKESARNAESLGAAAEHWKKAGNLAAGLAAYYKDSKNEAAYSSAVGTVTETQTNIANIGNKATEQLNITAGKNPGDSGVLSFLGALQLGMTQTEAAAVSSSAGIKDAITAMDVAGMSFDPSMAFQNISTAANYSREDINGLAAALNAAGANGNAFKNAVSKAMKAAGGVVDSSTAGMIAQIKAVLALLDALADVKVMQNNLATSTTMSDNLASRTQERIKETRAFTIKGTARIKELTERIGNTPKGGAGSGGGSGSGGRTTVDKVIDPIKLAEEQVRYLRDLARQKYVNKYVTMSPNVVVNATISKEVDGEALMNQLEQTVANSWAAALTGS